MICMKAGLSLPDDKEWTVWLALEEDEALGTVGFRPEEEDGHADARLSTDHVPERGSHKTTGTRTRHQHCPYLAWIGAGTQEGFEICYTNWISPNLLASRFWPRFGFKDVAYRLGKKGQPDDRMDERGITRPLCSLPKYDSTFRMRMKYEFVFGESDPRAGGAER